MTPRSCHHAPTPRRSDRPRPASSSTPSAHSMPERVTGSIMAGRLTMPARTRSPTAAGANERSANEGSPASPRTPNVPYKPSSAPTAYLATPRPERTGCCGSCWARTSTPTTRESRGCVRAPGRAGSSRPSTRRCVTAARARRRVLTATNSPRPRPTRRCQCSRRSTSHPRARPTGPRPNNLIDAQPEHRRPAPDLGRHRLRQRAGPRRARRTRDRGPRPGPRGQAAR